MNTGEGELVRAVLCFAMRCAMDGRADRLQEMGLGEGEVTLLRALRLEDVQRADLLFEHGLSVVFDAAVFGSVLRHLRVTREVEELQRELIRLDAPREMMRRLFGMGSREYAQLRRELGIEGGVGRPVELDEATDHRLWHALSGRLRPDRDRPLEPAEFLAVCIETGISLRAVWKRARSWAAVAGSHRGRR